MPADRLLGTLLRALLTQADQQDTPRLLGTTSSLLISLHNPLNVSLLTSQLLAAPAIWAQPEGLKTSMRCLSVFHSAAQSLIRHEESKKDKASDKDYSQPPIEQVLPRNEWIRSVVSGADEHSPRWRHLLVIGGLLLGFGSRENHHISRSMRQTLERALTTAVNLALKDPTTEGELAQGTVALVLNHCFPLLGNYERARLDYDPLLPLLVRSTLYSSEGLRSGYFLGAVDIDVYKTTDEQLRWPEQSPSFQLTTFMLSGPLLSSLGPLSRLIGHSIEQVKDSSLIVALVDDLENFARTLHTQWRQNKLSSVDPSEQTSGLDVTTRTVTTPALWKLLQSMLFASVIILKSALGRVLGDNALAKHSVAPLLAEESLSILRSLYFISARQGSASFSQYNFVHYTALDILAMYPAQVQSFLMNIKPTTLGTVPNHALDRNLDLFFLNTAEHFYLLLPAQIGETLIVPAVTAYLTAGARNNLLLPLFEAAHSVTLAMFSAPQNVAGTLRYLPFYVNSLFTAFPAHLSPRQFRLAFKSLLKLVSPPSKLALQAPLLPATLLELLHDRAKHASTNPIPLQPGSPEEAAVNAATEESPAPPLLSEQAVIALTILDTLTEIPLPLLDEWLPLVADTINLIDDDPMRDFCRDSFWQVLVGGEMDPERSRVCHAWWSTAGGRDLLLYGSNQTEMEEGDVENGEHQAVMSGALPTSGVKAKL